MAARYAPAHVTLDEVHRFRTPDGARDEDYEDLSLRMRDGRDAAATFDRLVDRGNVIVHRTEQDVTGASLLHCAVTVCAPTVTTAPTSGPRTPRYWFAAAIGSPTATPAADERAG